MKLGDLGITWQHRLASRLIAEHERTVVFVTSLLRPREIKMATALRGIGWKVILLYTRTTPFHPEQVFDLAIRYGSDVDLHRAASLLRPRLCHVFSGAVDDVVLRFCREHPSKVVVDLNDIFCPSLFNYLPERFEPTREVLARADAIVCRDLQARFANRYDGYALPPKTLLFPEYCWVDPAASPAVTSTGDDEVRVVSVGTFTLETQGMYDSAYLQLARRLTDQKIHFHIYPHWFYRDTPGSSFRFDQKAHFADFLQLEQETPYLHLHDSIPVDELAKVLPQYDFGIVAGGCEALGQKLDFLTDRYMQCCFSGRIADYIDAKLPVLINPEVAFNFRLLRHYGVGIDLHGVLSPDFRDTLLAHKRDPDLRVRVDRCRAALDLRHQGHRLGRFYESIADDRRTPRVKPSIWMSTAPPRPPLSQQARRIAAAVWRRAKRLRGRAAVLADQLAQERARVASLTETNTSVSAQNAALTGENATLQANVRDLRQEIRFGGTHVDEVAGLLNWPEIADQSFRTQGFDELTRILGLFMRQGAADGGSAAVQPSEAWRILSRKNLDQLVTDGYAHFKRTIALNYFTFPVQAGDEQIARLEALVGADEAKRQFDEVRSLPDDPRFNLNPQVYFRYLIALLWAHARSTGAAQTLDRLEEPLEGDPITIPLGGRRVSQDLVNSVLEYGAITSRAPIGTGRRLLEIGGGYGRNAFVFGQLHPDIRIVMLDIPPALYIAQRYLTSVFPGRATFRVQEFRSYAHVAAEIEAASFTFLLPHQLALLPDGFFDLAINISSFGEMTRDQIAFYFDQIDRTTSGHLFHKQWQKSQNPFDSLVLTSGDYPVKPRWSEVFVRPNDTNPAFFEAMYEIGSRRG